MVQGAIERLLQDIKFLLSRNDRGKRCIGYEQISVISSGVSILTTAPSNTFSAVITIEADATATTPSKVIRYTENGTIPSASVGAPLGNLDTYEVQHLDNIKLFKVIGIEGGKTHTLNVHYYQQS